MLQALASFVLAAVMWVQVPQWQNDWSRCAVDVPDVDCHSDTVQRLPMSLSKVSAMGGWRVGGVFVVCFAGVRGSGHAAASPHAATWGFRIRCTCSRRWCAWVHQCCGLAASPSARAGPETELTLKKDLGRGRRQRKRGKKSSGDHD